MHIFIIVLKLFKKNFEIYIIVLCKEITSIKRILNRNLFKCLGSNLRLCYPIVFIMFKVGIWAWDERRIGLELKSGYLCTLCKCKYYSKIEKSKNNIQKGLGFDLVHFLFCWHEDFAVIMLLKRLYLITRNPNQNPSYTTHISSYKIYHI